jgi:undecaprenyl-diphosphatase
VLLAGGVSGEDAGDFDRTVLLALRAPGDPGRPLGPLWLTLTAQDITSLGGYPIVTLVSLLTAGLLLIVGKRGAALLVLIAVGGGMLLTEALKDLLDRARPDLVPHGVNVYTASFPSAHAMLSAITYLTLGAVVVRVQAGRRVKAYVSLVAVVLTLLVGASRVFLGVHWPTDVLAGWCAGAAWAVLCWLIALWLQRRGVLRSGSR